MGTIRRQALSIAFGGLAFFAAAAPPAGIPAVEVRIEAEFGAFRLVNHGPALQLSSAVTVERQSKDRWEDAHVSNLQLIPQCTGAAVPKCISLAAGGVLRPVPWRGNYCYSQCPASCDLDGSVPPGTYRLVVTTCDQKRRFASPPFEKK